MLRRTGSAGRGRRTLGSLRVVLALAALVASGAGGCGGDGGGAEGRAVTTAGSLPSGPTAGAATEPLPWYAGGFRTLPERSGDLVEIVAGLAHPRGGAYGALDAGRAIAVTSFLDALFGALEEGRADGRRGDWCGVRAAAARAGYDLARLRDTVSGRWYVFGWDTTDAGQAYFLVDPEARRDLVIEVPHAPSDEGTDVQGARIFRDLAARALILNKDHRCSHAAASGCGDGLGPCGPYRESDMAHAVDSVFQALHRWYSDAGPTRFAQLHGFDGSGRDKAEIADGTSDAARPGAVSSRFAERLRARVPVPAAVHSCQDEGGGPPARLCATGNVQARYTHAPLEDECGPGGGAGTERFLHIEQDATLRDEDDGDGYCWSDVRDALAETWPECDLGGGDCAPAPPHAALPPCACGRPCE